MPRLADSAPSVPAGGPARDRRRILRALLASCAFITALLAVHLLQADLDWSAWTVRPRDWAGLRGVLGAPLLHGGAAHLLANSVALLMLGTLAGSVYPRATLASLPLLWLGSGLGAWLLGEAGSQHLGASGLTHGLMLLVFVLGILRRDRAAIAAGMIAFFLYGGMLLSVLPQQPGVSWQSHLGGALAGILCAGAFRRLDPQPPRPVYSWELEADATGPADAGELEPPAPADVPVRWHRPPQTGGTVLPFRRPGD